MNTARLLSGNNGIWSSQGEVLDRPAEVPVQRQANLATEQDLEAADLGYNRAVQGQSPSAGGDDGHIGQRIRSRPS